MGGDQQASTPDSPGKASDSAQWAPFLGATLLAVVLSAVSIVLATSLDASWYVVPDAAIVSATLGYVQSRRDLGWRALSQALGNSNGLTLATALALISIVVNPPLSAWHLVGAAAYAAAFFAWAAGSRVNSLRLVSG